MTNNFSRQVSIITKKSSTKVATSVLVFWFGFGGLLVSSLGLLISSLSILPVIILHFKQANLASFLPFITTLKVNN